VEVELLDLRVPKDQQVVDLRVPKVKLELEQLELKGLLDQLVQLAFRDLKDHR
jgi:hypothetical protein